MSDLRPTLIRLAASLPAGAERTALLDVLAASEDEENQILRAMLGLSGMKWRYIPQPEDAAGGPVDSGTVADYLRWGGGGAASVLRVLYRKGLVGAVKGARGKNRWYLTQKGMALAKRLPTPA